jgi:hypothetical protein
VFKLRWQAGGQGELVGKLEAKYQDKLTAENVLYSSATLTK